MPCLIADSGPLIALAKLGLLDLPSRLFGRAGLPKTVFSECLAQAGLPDAKAIRSAVETGHLELMPDLDWPTDEPVPRLDAGELAVLAIAKQIGAAVLMDERRGRDSARRMGLPVVGVCGLLLRANRLAWIGSLAPLMAQLRHEGYFISSDLVTRVLAHAGEQPLPPTLQDGNPVQ